MKMLVCGVVHRSGTSEKGQGRPYDFASINCLAAIEPVTNSYRQQSGAGYEQVAFSLDKSVIPTFAGLRFPLVLDLQTEARPNGNRLETVIVGFNEVKAA